MKAGPSDTAAVVRASCPGIVFRSAHNDRAAGGSRILEADRLAMQTAVRRALEKLDAAPVASC